MRLERINELLGVFIKEDGNVEKFNDILSKKLPTEERINISITLEISDEVVYVRALSSDIELMYLLNAQRAVTQTIDNIFRK